MEEKEERIEDLSVEEIDKERKRLRRQKYYRAALKRTISVLIVVAAVAVLIATLFLPILQISGDSMSPTLENKEIVVLLKTKKPDRNDIVGFYYQGKILLKRVIALPGETVTIDAEGKVFINEKELKESYVLEACLGDCDIEFPFVVPEEEYFVLGDKRTNSVDSRSSVIGTIKREELIGKVFFRAYPFNRVDFIN